MNNCRHVYENIGFETCPDCNKATHEVNWQLQATLLKEWKLANPDAKYNGWWSI